jgi:hypothetical protein
MRKTDLMSFFLSQSFVSMCLLVQVVLMDLRTLVLFELHAYTSWSSAFGPDMG